MISSALSAGVMSIQSGMKLMDSSAQTIAHQSVVESDSTASPPGSQPAGTSPLISPTGDVTEALIKQRLGLYQVQAGAKVIQTTDKAFDSLLDISA